jgi:L-ascorbate metabolism protein UlaG (beta-lactamase superfamily)
MTRRYAILGLIVLCSSFILHPSSLSQAQEKKEPEPKQKMMTIRWFGQSFFQVESGDKFTFAFDPHAIPAFGRRFVKAEFVIVSHSHEDHSLIEMIDTGKVDEKTKEPKRIAESDVYRGVTETKTGKQEWKTIDEKRGTIKIRNVATYHDPNNGLTRGKNSVFLVEVNGLVICHLGDLGHELTSDQVKTIGKVDILMIPIGGIYTINGEQAQAVMKQLKPRLYVFPMHYGVPGYDDLAGPEEFLDGLPKEQVKKFPATNEFAFPLDTKADAPSVIMLSWKKDEKKEEPKKEEPKKKP